MLRTFSAAKGVSSIRNGLTRYSTDSTTHEGNAHWQLRELLRRTAQPVAVVTSLTRSGSSNDDSCSYHGATLSSFASIAMDPYPLISFALRIPSRMAFSLKSAQRDLTSHMVINILSSEQAAVAVKFSRPDIHPEPFHSVPYQLTQEGLPILEGSLGALSCKLASSGIPLHDLNFLEKRNLDGEVAQDLGNVVVSELFIGRVVRVEMVEIGPANEGRSLTLPLLYHRRGYTSCLPPGIPTECK